MNLKNLIFILLISLILYSCKNKENEYLGDIPNISNNYIQKINKMETERIETKNIQEKLKIEQDIKEINREFENIAYKELPKDKLKPIKIQFPFDSPLKIKKINFKNVHKNIINYDIIVSLDKNNIEKSSYTKINDNVTFFYGTICVDKNNNEIPSTLTLQSLSCKSDFSGKIDAILNIKSAEDLSEFEKVKIISKKEYDSRNKLTL